jgi:hypothetical protein
VFGAEADFASHCSVSIGSSDNSVGATFGSRAGSHIGPEPNLASKIDISGHYFSVLLFIGPYSYRAVMTFSRSRFRIRRTQFGPLELNTPR